MDVRRKAPKPLRAKLDLRETGPPVSFAEDGVKTLFRFECSRCHLRWALSYGGVKRYAEKSLRQVRTGEMPSSGQPLPPAEIELLAAWIRGGRKR